MDASDKAVNKPNLASTQTPIQVQNSFKGFTVKEWTWCVVQIVHRVAGCDNEPDGMHRLGYLGQLI